VDILHPGQGADPINYLELAMREDFRCDLRFGKRMKAVAASGAHRTSLGKREVSPDSSAVLGVLQDVMNPDGGEDAIGNWGRWNFTGGGPGAAKVISHSEVGAVVSCPKAADQAVHADTPHLYEHIHVSKRELPYRLLKQLVNGFTASSALH
jgi:hypothetical protein